MRHISYLISGALLLASTPALAQYDDPREAARKVSEQAMAKALAEKARNDAIVEQQRAAERARKASPTPTPTPSPTPPSKGTKPR